MPNFEMMTNTDITLVLLGLTIIIIRGPFVIWPMATRGVYQRLHKTNLRVRVIGLGLLPLLVAMILANKGDPRDAAIILTGLGSILIVFVLFFCLINPSLFRRLADAVLEDLEMFMLRGVGVFAVILGAYLVYWGLYRKLIF